MAHAYSIGLPWAALLTAALAVGCSKTSQSQNTMGGDAGETGTDTESGSSATDSFTTSATTTDTESTGTGGFVQMPDGGNVSECDPKAQDCPDGQKCAAWASDGGSSWNANKCVPVTGDGVHGDECMVEGSGVSGLDDCAKGFMCWDVDPETNTGTCVQFCDEQENCDAPDTICAVQNDGTLPLCIEACDPLLQDCPDGQGCYAKDGDNGLLICIPDASGAGGADGDPCEFDNVCDPGLVCIGGAFDCPVMWCCTPWCDLNAPNTCPGTGESCIPHFDDPPPGLEHVGICIIPP